MLPNFLEKRLRAMAGQRCLMFLILNTQDNPTTLSSIVDTDELPSGSLDALHYFPRAAQLGIFSPFPSSWMYVFDVRPSFFYTIVPLETIVLYVGLVGLLCWLLKTGSWTILTPVFISLTAMTIFGYAIPFIGSLYRYRYPFWMLMICIGVAATYEVVRSKNLN